MSIAKLFCFFFLTHEQEGSIEKHFQIIVRKVESQKMGFVRVVQNSVVIL